MPTFVERVYSNDPCPPPPPAPSPFYPLPSPTPQSPVIEVQALYGLRFHAATASYDLLFDDDCHQIGGLSSVRDRIRDAFEEAGAVRAQVIAELVQDGLYGLRYGACRVRGYVDLTLSEGDDDGLYTCEAVLQSEFADAVCVLTDGTHPPPPAASTPVTPAPPIAADAPSVLPDALVAAFYGAAVMQRYRASAEYTMHEACTEQRLRTFESDLRRHHAIMSAHDASGIASIEANDITVQLVVLNSFYGLGCVLLVNISYAAEVTDTSADTLPAFDPWDGDACLIFGPVLLPDCEIQYPPPPAIAPSFGELTVASSLLTTETSDGEAFELYGFYGVASRADALLVDEYSTLQTPSIPTVVAAPDAIFTSAGQFYGLHHDRRYSATAMLHLKNACGEEELHALAAYLRAYHATRSAESDIHREVAEDAVHVLFTNITSALYGIGCMVTVNITYDAAPMVTAADPDIGPTDPWDGDLCAMFGEFLMPETCTSSDPSPPATPSPPIISPQTQPSALLHVATEITITNDAFYGFYGLHVIENGTLGEDTGSTISQLSSRSGPTHSTIYGLHIGQRLLYGAQEALPLASSCDDVNVANLRRMLQRYHADRSHYSSLHATVESSQVSVIITLHSELYGLGCVADVRIAYEAEALDDADVDVTNDDAPVMTDPWNGDPCLMFGHLLQGCKQDNPTGAVLPPPPSPFSLTPPVNFNLHPREEISVTVDLYGFYGQTHTDAQSIALNTPNIVTDQSQSTQPSPPPNVSESAVYGLNLRPLRLYGASQTLPLTGACDGIDVAVLRSTLQVYHADLSRLSRTHAAVDTSQITVNITLHTAFYGSGCVAEVRIQYEAESLNDADVADTNDDTTVVTDPWDGDLCLMLEPLLPGCTSNDDAATISPPQATAPSPPTLLKTFPPQDTSSILVELYGFYGYSDLVERKSVKDVSETIVNRSQELSSPLQFAVYGLNLGARRLYGALRELPLQGPCDRVDVHALRLALQTYHADRSRESATHAAVEPSQVSVDITLRTGLYGLGCVADVGIEYEAEALSDADVDVTNDDATVVTDPWDGDACLMFGSLLFGCAPEAPANPPPPTTAIAPPPFVNPKPRLHDEEFVAVELYGFYGLQIISASRDAKHATVSHDDVQTNLALPSPDTVTTDAVVYGLNLGARRLYGALRELPLQGPCDRVDVQALRRALQTYHADRSHESATHAAVEPSQVSVDITLRSGLYGLGCVADVGIQYEAEALTDADVDVTNDDATVVTDPWDGDACLMFGPLFLGCASEDVATTPPPPSSSRIPPSVELAEKSKPRSEELNVVNFYGFYGVPMLVTDDNDRTAVTPTPQSPTTISPTVFVTAAPTAMVESMYGLSTSMGETHLIRLHGVCEDELSTFDAYRIGEEVRDAIMEVNVRVTVDYERVGIFYGAQCNNAVAITFQAQDAADDTSLVDRVITTCTYELARCCAEQLALSTTAACSAHNIGTAAPTISAAAPTATPTAMPTSAPTTTDRGEACGPDYAFVSNRTNLYYANRMLRIHESGNCSDCAAVCDADAACEAFECNEGVRMIPNYHPPNVACVLYNTTEVVPKTWNCYFNMPGKICHHEMPIEILTQHFATTDISMHYDVWMYCEHDPQLTFAPTLPVQAPEEVTFAYTVRGGVCHDNATAVRDALIQNLNANALGNVNRTLFTEREVRVSASVREHLGLYGFDMGCTVRFHVTVTFPYSFNPPPPPLSPGMSHPPTAIAYADPSATANDDDARVFEDALQSCLMDPVSCCAIPNIFLAIFIGVDCADITHDENTLSNTVSSPPPPPCPPPVTHAPTTATPTQAPTGAPPMAPPHPPVPPFSPPNPPPPPQGCGSGYIGHHELTNLNADADSLARMTPIFMTDCTVCGEACNRMPLTGADESCVAYECDDGVWSIPHYDAATRGVACFFYRDADNEIKSSEWRHHGVLPEVMPLLDNTLRADDISRHYDTWTYCINASSTVMAPPLDRRHLQTRIDEMLPCGTAARAFSSDAMRRREDTVHDGLQQSGYGVDRSDVVFHAIVDRDLDVYYGLSVDAYCKVQYTVNITYTYAPVRTHAPTVPTEILTRERLMELTGTRPPPPPLMPVSSTMSQSKFLFEFNFDYDPFAYTLDYCYTNLAECCAMPYLLVYTLLEDCCTQSASCIFAGVSRPSPPAPLLPSPPWPLPPPQTPYAPAPHAPPSARRPTPLRCRRQSVPSFIHKNFSVFMGTGFMRPRLNLLVAPPRAPLRAAVLRVRAVSTGPGFGATEQHLAAGKR
ncbi:hypothetical protein CYMTET_5449 [Cymbomonas tetramitiformis]|uniref:Uncharacterized protein n=1 Tax=Cymbomonas tetramitiformis TaxID=36881 RepID=A0AAE0GZB7_9CHLO|nr:hypothetical protein CYMTET_5449 [Cymbomonas tetramitiformis]